MAKNNKISALKGVAFAAAFATLATPGVAMADEATTTANNKVEQPQQVQEVTPEQAQQAIQDMKAVTPQEQASQVVQQQIDVAQQQVNADTQAQQQAQQEQAAAQQAQQQVQAQQEAAQQQAQQAQAAEQAAQQAAQQAQQVQQAQEEQVAQAQDNLNKVQGEEHATQEDVTAQQDKVDQVQADVNAGQTAADIAQKEEAEQQAKTDAANQQKDTAAGIRQQAIQKVETATANKAEADKQAAEAQKTLEDAKTNHQGQVDKAVQELADAKVNQVKAQGDYNTKKEAEDAAQKSLDAAKKALDDAKKEPGTGVDQAKVNKGFAGLLESVMNDPSATQAQKADATSAYKLLTTGVYEGSKLSWFDKVNTADKEDGTSIVGLQNALTYFDAVNAIRKKNDLNELGISLSAMVMAMMNTSYSGQVDLGHSGMFPANENIANGVYGEYTGTTDVDLWQKAYDAQWNNGPHLTEEEEEKLGNSWPFTGWYTAEKNLAESGTTNYTSIGHYRNLISGGISSFGFGVGDGIAAFDGSWDTPSYTTAGFTNLVNSYVKALNTSNSAGIQQAQEKYDAAKTAYDKAQEESNAAKAALDAANAKLKDAQANSDKVNSPDYLTNLENDVKAKQTKADEAQSKLDAAKQEQKTAEDSYAKAVQTAQDEAAKLALKKDNTAAAKKNLSAMLKTLQDAQAKLDEIKADASILPDAQAKLAGAEKALKEAQDAYQKALKEYDFAKVTSANATDELNNKIKALQDAEVKLQAANDKLNDAIAKLAKSTKTLKELQAIKDKLDGKTPEVGNTEGEKPSTNKEDAAAKPTGVIVTPAKSQDKGIQTTSEEAVSKAADTVNHATASGENLASTGVGSTAMVILTVSLAALGAGVTILKNKQQA